MKEFKGKLDRNIMNLAISKLLDNVSAETNIALPKLTDELISEMLSNSIIQKCMNTLIRGVVSRELVIKSEENQENDTKILEIQKRINKIENKTLLIENIAQAYFKKMTVHEIVYNEDKTIKKLVKIPNRIIKYDKYKKQFNLKNNNVDIILDNPYKWLLSIHREGVGYNQGYSVLEEVLQDYINIKNINNKINHIVNKYGETILFFAYSIDQSDEDVKQTAEDLKKANGQNVVGIPLSDGNLRDSIFTLRLSDIDTVIHERLLDRYEKNIMTVLLGSTLTIDNGNGGSSYALGEIHQSEKEKVEDSIALFVRDELDKLIEIDAYLFGYDYTKYYISIDREERERDRLEVDKAKQELRQAKANEILTLSNAGYEIDEEELQNITGFKTIKKKEQPTQRI
ncbi:DUF935 family protein [Streptobacillus moniliformis]|uniref:phage portal protein family protein n=1 Tax=Streptobacillus moniliformis TaxID=34105 RepID=UPI0007E49C7C|nr:DUF935 family protein [Streptobacillus moniliformis]